MNLDDEAKEAVRELGDAINSAIEKSPRVSEAIERLREIGYEPNLTLRLEIGLQELTGEPEEPVTIETEPEDIKLNLTDEDLKTLRRMKIRIE